MYGYMDEEVQHMSYGWEEVVKVKEGENTSVLLGKKSEDNLWLYKKQETKRKVGEKEMTLVKPGSHATFRQMTTQQSGIVTGWKAALSLLDSSFWNLQPEVVHPRFRIKVWSLINKREKDANYSKWQQLCFPEGPELAILASWMHHSSYTVIISGHATSMLDEDKKILSAASFISNEEEFYHYYSSQLKKVFRQKANNIHTSIAKLQKQNLVSSIITENTDGLFQVAGCNNIFELHGTLKKCHCHFCGRNVNPRLFLTKKNCPECGGSVRPSIVLLGEKLPMDTWKRAALELKKAELVIIIGTDLSMNPSNKLTSYTNGKKVYIHAESEAIQDGDLLINGNIEKNVAQLSKILLSTKKD
jgi:NAD-dependent deacetylase